MRERTASSAETVFEQKRRELKNYILPINGNPQDKFFIESEVRQLWNLSIIGRLMPSLPHCQRPNVLRDYAIVLSILAYIDWTFDESVFKDKFVDRDRMTDNYVPFGEDYDLAFLRPLEVPFLEKQMLFKPCEIKTRANMRIQRYQQGRPWPFLEKEQIATGFFSTVWKATVAPGYYSSAPNQCNDKATTVAYKILRKKKDYAKEHENLEYLRESMSGHRHVCLHIAAVMQGNDFYVFLHWTPYGDLEMLLNGGRDRQKDTVSRWVDKYDFHKEFGYPQRSQYVQQLANIASAIHYLHKELIHSTTGAPFYCTHKDLKPRNILIYPDPERDDQKGGVGRWMISDFGISSIAFRRGGAKGKSKEGSNLKPVSPRPADRRTNSVGNSPNDKHSTFKTIGDIADNISQVQSDNADDDDAAITEHLEGTCVAPELHRRSKLPRDLVMKCDIWSFGCIAAEVFACLVGLTWQLNAKGGAYEFSAFQRRRLSRGAADDSFFDHEPNERKSVPCVRLSVTEYFKEHKDQFMREKRNEVKWVSAFIDLLKEILIIEPSERPEALKIEESLAHIRDIIPHEKELERIGELEDVEPEGPAQFNTPRIISDDTDCSSILSDATDDGIASGDETPKGGSLRNSTWSFQQYLPEPGPNDSVSVRDRPLSSRASSAISPPGSGQSPEVSFPSEVPRFAKRLDAPRPVVESMNLLTGVKKCSATAVSPLGDTAAWLLPGRSSMDKPALRVYNVSRLRKNGIIPIFAYLPIIPGVQWDSEATRLLIASSYVSVIALTKNHTMTGLFFDARNNEFLTCPWHLPSELKQIIPSQNGIFAIIRGGSNEILLWNSAISDPQNAGVQVPSAEREVLKCAFNPDGTRFFIWYRKQGSKTAGGSVKYVIMSYDLGTFPRLSEPMYHTFQRTMATREIRSLVPLQGSAACFYTQSPEHFLLWANPESGNAGQVECSISKSLPALGSQYIQVACSTDWFVSVRPKVMSGYELYETAFKVSKSGNFDVVRDSKIVDLPSSECWIAASSEPGVQNITIINLAGKVYKIKIDWSGGY